MRSIMSAAIAAALGLGMGFASAQAVNEEGPTGQQSDSGQTPQARDYYLVEDKQGQRFWIYREGVYRANERQRWFMHGLFP